MLCAVDKWIASRLRRLGSLRLRRVRGWRCSSPPRCELHGLGAQPSRSGSAIVLDDHLVHSDPKRLEWFRQALVKAAVRTRVIILTCRPQDYLSDAEMPEATPFIDLAGGAIRAVDLARVMTRYQNTAAQAPPESNVERVEQARAS